MEQPDRTNRIVLMVRTLCCALSSLTLAAAAAAQTPASPPTPSTQTAITQDEVVLQGDTTPRRALPMFFGDTGFWFVPTADTLPARRWSVSLFRANFDRRQGLTDISEFGLTGAFAVTDRLELFGSWRVVRIDRDVRPTFIPTEPVFRRRPAGIPVHAARVVQASARSNTTSRSVSGAPTRCATTSSTAASQPRGCGPSATAKSGRLPTTPRRRAGP